MRGEKFEKVVKYGGLKIEMAATQPKVALEYVKRHSNVFSDRVRRDVYLNRTWGVVIREMEKYKDELYYHFWVFIKRMGGEPPKVIVYSFEGKPSREALERMMDDIEREVEGRGMKGREVRGEEFWKEDEDEFGERLRLQVERTKKLLEEFGIRLKK